jgi:two-component system, cell cycle sensor histidine kinase and response regulator CckA
LSRSHTRNLVVGFALAMGDSAVLSALCDALALGDPEEALVRGLSVLAAVGVVARAPPHGEPWLSIESGGRSVSLFASSVAEGLPPRGVVAEGLPPRGVVANLFRIGLARAALDEQARKTQERLDMLSAASFEGILVHADGVVIDVNRRFAEMMGYERADILGQNTTRRFVVPEDLPDVLARMQSGYEGAYVITGIRQGGARFRAELQSKQGHLGDRPVRVVAVRDVTERERTLALLLESEARLRDLAAGAFDGILYDRNGIVVDVAGPLRERFGLDPQDLTSRAVLDLAAASSRAFLASAIEEDRTGSWEVEILGPGGEPIPVEAVVVRSTLGGEPVRVVGLRDLREKRRLEGERAGLRQQVERSQRMESLGVLAGGIAHDFNNLLVGVLGNAEFLLDRMTDPPARQAALAIRSAGERAAGLTAQMLAYAGRGELGRREPVDLGALCRELRELLDAVLSKKALLKLSIAPDGIVLGDRATLTQVLMNLLTNASDALGDEPGVIRITTRRTRLPDARFHHALGAPVGPGHWVLIEVEDTGVGMDAGTVGRIFEPFFSTKEKGHGLGLAACLGIVSAHGGAIVVDSKVGQGSSFAIILPAAASTEPASSESPPTAPPQALRVLVVDDEPLVRSLIRRLLERRGFTVEEACDGRSALATLERIQVDLIVLDMTMPDLDGAQVVRRVRASGSNVPILLSSGYMAAAAENALERSMIQGFLAKPFGSRELMEAVDRALEK